METLFPDGRLEDGAELGAVDDRSVRVWVRRPGAPLVSASLEVEGVAPVVAATTVSPEADWTGALVLSLPAPAPDRPFTCVVGRRRLRGRLAPTPGSHTGLTFAFGNCHRPFTVATPGSGATLAATGVHPALAEAFVRRRPATPAATKRVLCTDAAGIYPRMQAELARAGARFLLLVGDQVYSDELPTIDVRKNLTGDDRHPPSLDEAVAAYRTDCGEQAWRRPWRVPLGGAVPIPPGQNRAEAVIRRRMVVAFHRTMA